MMLNTTSDMSFTMSQVSQMLGVNYNTVNKWVKLGDIKHTVENGRIVITHEQLSEFLKDHRRYGNMSDVIVQRHSANLYDDDIMDRLDAQIHDLKAARDLIDISISQVTLYRNKLAEFKAGLI